MRRVFYSLIIGSMVAISLAGTRAYAAPILVDNFSTALSPSNPFVATTLGLSSETSTNVPGLFGVGTTTRVTTIDVLIHGSAGTNMANIASNAISFQSSTNDKANVSLAYSNFGTIDLTGTAIMIPVLSYNNGSNNSATSVTVTLNTVGGPLTSSMLLSTVGPTNAVFPTSGFGGPVNQVTGITFAFAPQNGTSGTGTGFVIDANGITISAVPEPSSILLFFGALISAGVYYRKKRASQTSAIL